MIIIIDVENIRCGGCINTITKKLLAIDGVNTVDIQLDEQRVTLEVDDEGIKKVATEVLVKLGYPEKGSVTGMEALKGKAKSVVSCAVGKI
ncbi:MAG TPA: heavy-metal-associated domain-containing protein [Thiothrix sp.]|nr:heavy-metal-associated domain-containing protein [Thiothrix sp.]